MRNLVFALGFTALLAGCAPPQADPVAPDGTELPPLNADSRIGPNDMVRASIAEIVDAYEANEAAAQMSYNGKWIIATGEVEEIGLDFDDEPVIRFKSKTFPSASARYAKEWQDTAASLKKGQTLVLVCGKISEFVGTPGLRECMPFDEGMIAATN